jgi:putative restriction endonuclease
MVPGAGVEVDPLGGETVDPDLIDMRVRQEAFGFLDRLRAEHGEALAWRLLLEGFAFEGHRVPLVSPQGIFRPGVLREVPLSIRTAPEVEGRARPYEDGFFADDLIQYRYRGTDPGLPENVGLRLAWKHRLPLVYFYGLVPGRYAAAYPAYIVGDDPANLSFTVQVAEALLLPVDGVADSGADARRAYHTAVVKRRLHQEGFRQRVLSAYQERCAVCRLRHSGLLDAAHILPDGHPRGDPVVPNGLSLCKLHHAAFDLNFLGVRPDLVVEIREDLLREHDGPMLVHGLQEFQGRRIVVPPVSPLQPDQDRLAERYERFRRTG